MSREVPDTDRPPRSEDSTPEERISRAEASAEAAWRAAGQIEELARGIARNNEETVRQIEGRASEILDRLQLAATRPAHARAPSPSFTNEVERAKESIRAEASAFEGLAPQLSQGLDQLVGDRKPARRSRLLTAIILGLIAVVEIVQLARELLPHH